VKRTIALVALGAVVCMASAQKPPLDPAAFRERYREMGRAYSAKNLAGYAKFLSRELSAQSREGLLNREAMVRALRNLFERSDALSLTYQVRSLEGSPTEARIVVRSVRIAVVRENGRRRFFESARDQRHIWKRKGAYWQIVSIENLGAPAYGRVSPVPIWI
jgi:hypothetical protein